MTDLAHCAACSSSPLLSGPSESFTMNHSGGAMSFPPFFISVSAMGSAAYPNRFANILNKKDLLSAAESLGVKSCHFDAFETICRDNLKETGNFLRWAECPGGRTNDQKIQSTQLIRVNITYLYCSDIPLKTHRISDSRGYFLCVTEDRIVY